MRSIRRKQLNGKDERSLQEDWKDQGNILCKEGMIKDRDGKDLTEAEEIKKRGQEYTEELYRKVLKITTMVSSLT